MPYCASSEDYSLGLALQHVVAQLVLKAEGGDLVQMQWEPECFLADLAVV